MMTGPASSRRNGDCELSPRNWSTRLGKWWVVSMRVEHSTPVGAAVAFHVVASRVALTLDHAWRATVCHCAKQVRPDTTTRMSSIGACHASCERAGPRVERKAAVRCMLRQVFVLPANCCSNTIALGTCADLEPTTRH